MEGVYLVLILLVLLLVALVLGLAYFGALVLMQRIRRLLNVQQYQQRTKRMRATGRDARSAMDDVSEEFMRQAYRTLRR